MSRTNQPNPTNQTTRNSLPLSGITVFDLSRLYPGPLCAQLLQDLGALVIKIEDQSGGDPTRYFPPLMKEEEDSEKNSSYLFHCFNRNKKSIALDFKRKDISQMLKKILFQKELFGHETPSGVRVLIDSARPGKLEQLLGIKHVSELWEEFPALVICRISAFGQDVKKYGDMPAHDMNTVGAAGIFNISGDVSEKNSGLKPLPIQLSDVMTGYSSALQVTSLIRKLESILQNPIFTQQEKIELLKQVNRQIDVSMFDNAIATIQMSLTLQLNGYEEMASNGRHVLAGSILGYNIYPTREGLLSVGCLEPHFWKAFLTVLSRYETIHSCPQQEQFKDSERPSNNTIPQQIHSQSSTRILPLTKYTSPQYLFSNDSELKSRITKILTTKTAWEWEEIFTQHCASSEKLPVTKIRTLHEIDRELLRERNMIANMDQKKQRWIVKNALDYSSLLKNTTLDHSLQGDHHQRGPQLGEHNAMFLISKL
ncbi:hypothetical protein C9374_012989 [Naegleria lovaniensis]|uniref:CoA transferase n=1 Tax=Naegleria lovaniensis TaxID=51637 RepID=A0AA88GE65_NAELO|nr:uncharacterized protein C9374_012989 [Naegleria lovaniensis]KAG2372959.1 hypothetical protein C9374_012989 [Naegleria lovaniensis]